MRCSFPRGVHSARVVASIAASAHLLLIAACGAPFLAPGPKTEDHSRRAGDGAGDGGQARIGRAPASRAIGDDGDGVALALIVANNDTVPGLSGVVASRRSASPSKNLRLSRSSRQRPAPAGHKRSFAPTGPARLLAGSSEDHAPVSPKARQAQASGNEQSRPRSRPGFVACPRMATIGTFVASRKPCRQQSDTPLAVRVLRLQPEPELLAPTAARKARTVCGCTGWSACRWRCWRRSVRTAVPAPAACFEFARPLG